MSIRSFRDAAGVVWQVCETPNSTESEVASRAGWLMFKAGDAQRRLRPIPHEWETVSPQRLEQMCRVAAPIDRGEVLRGLVESGQMLVTSVASPAPSAPLSEETAAIAGQKRLARSGVSDPAALRAYQSPEPYSRTTFRG